MVIVGRLKKGTCYLRALWRRSRRSRITRIDALKTLLRGRRQERVKPRVPSSLAAAAILNAPMITSEMTAED